MIISETAMRAVCQELYAVMVEETFGEQGVEALFLVIGTIRELYLYVAPEKVKGSIIVFCNAGNNDADVIDGGGELCADMGLLSGKAADGFIIKVCSDGRRYLYAAGIATASQLAKTSVVYEYQNKQESFFAGEGQKNMIPLIPAAASQFSVPTFFTIREALLNYGETCIRYSACRTFDNVWADVNRLFLKPKPEETMRCSLTDFLKHRLGAAYEVRPEQVMDESHPVDIKVTYIRSNRLMIIEIKWLGDSLNANGDVGTSYRDARAKEGAEQLAGYLDMNKKQAPLHVSHGYFVVIDARRRGLGKGSTSVTKENGLHYANTEIAFDPEFHIKRDDFDPPYRMFAEPLCA